MMNNSKDRFSHTVENYIKYRPHYPKEILTILKRECGLNQQSVVADIGSGTGILTELFLKEDYRVFAVEPNKAMREAAERQLNGYSKFYSVNASAEESTLEDHRIDLIVVAQAFHWFDHENAKKEFSRILKPTGFVGLVWNLRDTEASSFMKAYDDLFVEFGTDYKEVNAERVDDESIKKFFAPTPVQIYILPNKQVMDWDAFKGRLLSTSYAPKEDDKNYLPMLERAEEIFSRYQKDGAIEFIYQTKLYLSSLR